AAWPASPSGVVAAIGPVRVRRRLRRARGAIAMPRRHARHALGQKQGTPRADRGAVTIRPLTRPARRRTRAPSLHEGGSMTIEGGCYCGAVRYRAEGDPMFKGQCHCRECQYISGGHPNLVMAMPESGFSWTKGAPKQFRRKDLADPVTREFCAECGTHIGTRTHRLPGATLIKVGTFD